MPDDLGENIQEGETHMSVIKKKGVGKGKKYLATVYPVGGAPFTIDVETDEKGCVEHEGKMWFIVPGSSWQEGSKNRVVLPEAYAESLTSMSLAGKFFFNAHMFFMFMKINLLEHLHKLQDTKPWYGNASTWVIAGAIGLLILVGYVALNQVTGAIESLGGVIDKLDLSMPSGDRQGHQELEERR